MSRFIRKFAIAAVVSGAIASSAIQHHFASMEAMKPIDIEYQEMSPLDKGQSSERVNYILKYGVPVRSPDVSIYKNHALCYNQEKKIPYWVLELLAKDISSGSANRGKSNFKLDPHLPPIFASRNEDYSKSGWSRGHMAAAGNHKHDQDAMNDTFFLSNIVPQDIDNNSGFWNRMESYCRELVNKFDGVWVISGPLFLPQMEGDKKYMKYEVIGKSEVAVPTHLFKILVAEIGKRKLMGAFIVPNKPIPRNRTLKEHQVPVEYVESKSGFQFFPGLDRGSVEDLCKAEGCRLKPWEEFELYFITKKMESARTLNRVEKAWKEISEKGLKPDDQAISIYNKKKMELQKGDHEGASRSRG